jgi:dienelactone hydrolase
VSEWPNTLKRGHQTGRPGSWSHGAPDRLASRLRTILAVGAALWLTAAHAQEPLPQTQPLTLEGDLSAQMVAGIDKFLMRELERSVEGRSRLWKRDFSSREAYTKSVQPNRDRFVRSLGAIDPRLPIKALEFISTTAASSVVADTTNLVIHAVRWPVFEGVQGEGLLLQPKTEPAARVIVLPDADQTPEMLAGLAPGLPADNQFARRLAESGCQVLVPVLINRQDTWSGNPAINRFTNQPHREWIYRQAFELGRHIIGYEVQKVLAAVDWFASENAARVQAGGKPLKMGMAGYAEGGLIAFYSAAVDPRIDAAWVSGYFSSRQRLWEEPIYRNVFGLLHEFGDAEIASLIAPRLLVVEYSDVPKVDGPPLGREGHWGAAPGKLATPERFEVEAEVKRAQGFFGAAFTNSLVFVYGNEGITLGPGSDPALKALLTGLGVSRDLSAVSATPLNDARPGFDPNERQERQVRQLVGFTQGLLRQSERARDEFFWNQLKPSPTNDWAAAVKDYRKLLWEDVIGRFPPPSAAAKPRSRKLLDKPKWSGYEVVLDVWPEVFAWGHLLLPKDLKTGERRPVVVCQHGLEGLPTDTFNGPGDPGFEHYRSYAARLADRGFVVFAPHNPYRGEDRFRVLQRKANPLKKSLFSVIIGQHDRITEWLSGLPFVDPQRIGFYGLSYGGKTAMRVPAVLDRYAVSICSADFNDWIRKNATIDSPYSYLFMNEYEMPEFNLGNTFNYAEMAALIAPRPFMVERGHDDPVAPDEWVAYEYAKVGRLYSQLGIPERTALEIFEGGHAINAVGTFQFLYRHLNWQTR